MDFVTLRKLAAQMADTTRPSAPTCGTAATRSARSAPAPASGRTRSRAGTPTGGSASGNWK